MELQRQPLSMTRALMPARLASMAQARPVGPAPTQIMSYVVIGVRFPRPLFGYYIGCRKICFHLKKSYINFQESSYPSAIDECRDRKGPRNTVPEVSLTPKQVRLCERLPDWFDHLRSS